MTAARAAAPAAPPLPAARRRGLQAAVGAWGERHRRDLPWRRTRDPWWVLVSEVMLQQTQVSRVEPAYRRFVARFPTPAACAAAGPGAVVAAWAGLGYNRRALALHRAAVAVTTRHAGVVPGSLAELQALPGVGPYTARAVLAFAHEDDVGVVDTNVGRVLARAVAGHPLTPGRAQALADALVPPGGAWAHNQAMLDLGSRHCAARPRCDGCPLARQCAWARRGRPLPDPAEGSAATSRRQAPFEGSDRQGRGRLLDALRVGPVPAAAVPASAGWPSDPDRAGRVAGDLVAEGFAARGGDGSLRLA